MRYRLDSASGVVLSYDFLCSLDVAAIPYLLNRGFKGVFFSFVLRTSCPNRFDAVAVDSGTSCRDGYLAN